MSEVWYKEDLDRAFEEGCDHPDCAEKHEWMILGAQCCCKTPITELRYDGKKLTVNCPLCGKEMVSIIPASSLELTPVIG